MRDRKQYTKDAIFYPTEKLGWILDEEMHTQ